jgi:hypothetical protein
VWASHPRFGDHVATLTDGAKALARDDFGPPIDTQWSAMSVHSDAHRAWSTFLSGDKIRLAKLNIGTLWDSEWCVVEAWTTLRLAGPGLLDAWRIAGTLVSATECIGAREQKKTVGMREHGHIHTMNALMAMATTWTVVASVAAGIVSRDDARATLLVWKAAAMRYNFTTGFVVLAPTMAHALVARICDTALAAPTPEPVVTTSSAAKALENICDALRTNTAIPLCVLDNLVAGVLWRKTRSCASWDHRAGPLEQVGRTAITWLTILADVCPVWATEWKIIHRWMGHAQRSLPCAEMVNAASNDKGAPADAWTMLATHRLSSDHPARTTQHKEPCERNARLAAVQRWRVLVEENHLKDRSSVKNTWFTLVHYQPPNDRLGYLNDPEPLRAWLYPQAHDYTCIVQPHTTLRNQILNAGGPPDVSTHFGCGKCPRRCDLGPFADLEHPDEHIASVWGGEWFLNHGLSTALLAHTLRSTACEAVRILAAS